MTLVIVPSRHRLALAEIEAAQPGSAESAKSALWSFGFEDENSTLRVTRYDLMLFLWSTLPRKYASGSEVQMDVAHGLARFFDTVGEDAAEHAALCRDERTREVIEVFERSHSSGMKLLKRYAEGSRLAAPDTPEFAWGSVMGLHESTTRSEVERLIDDAVDTGDAVPSEAGFKRKAVAIATELLTSHGPWLPGDDTLGPSPLDDIRAERMAHHLRRGGQMWRQVVSPALSEAPIAAVGGLAPTGEPRYPLMRWLLAYGDGRIPLTATGNPGLAVVHAAIEEFPWLCPDRERFGMPHTADEVPPLQWHVELAREARLLRKRRGELLLSPPGKVALAEPAALDTAVARHLLASEGIEATVEMTGAALLMTRRQMRLADLDALITELVAEQGWRRRNEELLGEEDLSGLVLDLLWTVHAFGIATIDWSDKSVSLTENGAASLAEALLQAMWRPIHSL